MAAVVSYILFLVQIVLSFEMVFGLNIKQSQGCHCHPMFVDVGDENIPLKMCTEKIIFEAKVLQSEVVRLADLTEEIVYDINIWRILKGEDLVSKVNKGKLFAERDFTTCGPQVLTSSDTYFISVFVANGKLYFDRCSIVIPSGYETETQLNVMAEKVACPNDVYFSRILFDNNEI